MKRFKCMNRKGVALKRDGVDKILTAATHGEARHQFKKLFGERPANCKGTRKRLPVGNRVMEVA